MPKPAAPSERSAGYLWEARVSFLASTKRGDEAVCSAKICFTSESDRLTPEQADEHINLYVAKTRWYVGRKAVERIRNVTIDKFDGPMPLNFNLVDRDCGTLRLPAETLLLELCVGDLACLDDDEFDRILSRIRDIRRAAIEPYRGANS